MPDMKDKTPVRTVRIDDKLWQAVVDRAADLKRVGWPPISVSDVIRTGMREFIGEGSMQESYGSIHAAKVNQHTEDEK